ncbi:MAG: NAD-dependent epimerase/dehydratase family protein [Elusimicrobia bacterium]|nr:NAD-dependent epimerase/dehydratase family protein [Elusimicrobiota bacterium]
MKIFITGANGSIGRGLVSELTNNNLTHKPEFNIVALLGDGFGDIASDGKDLKFLTGDICNIDDKIKTELIDTDVIIHLAAVVHKPNAKYEEYIEINCNATKRLLDEFINLSNSKIKQFIFISTVSVYGNYKNSIYYEKDECKPDTPYGISKFMAEELIKNISSANKKYFNYTIIRLATVYGGSNDRGNVKKMIDFIQKYHFFPIFKKETEKSMIYIKDVVQSIKVCINNNKVYNDTLVLSSPPITIYDMVNVIRDTVKTFVFKVYIPLSFLKRFRVIDKLMMANVYCSNDTIGKLNLKIRDFKAGLTDMFSFKI